MVHPFALAFCLLVGALLLSLASGLLLARFLASSLGVFERLLLLLLLPGLLLLQGLAVLFSFFFSRLLGFGFSLGFGLGFGLGLLARLFASLLSLFARLLLGLFLGFALLFHLLLAQGHLLLLGLGRNLARRHCRGAGGGTCRAAALDEDAVEVATGVEAAQVDLAVDAGYAAALGELPQRPGGVGQAWRILGVAGNEELVARQAAAQVAVVE